MPTDYVDRCERQAEIVAYAAFAALGLLFVACVGSAIAGPPDQQRIMNEACSLVSQQRNSLSDAIAVSEAQRKVEGEDAAKVKQRVADWEAYFKAYVGEEK